MSGRPVSRGAAALANLALAESPGQALENEERAELADLFRLVDKDGSGSIDLAEFNELLSSMFCSGMTRPSATEMQTLFVEIDTNHNNTIEMDEWLDFLINTCVKSMDPTQLIKDFALFEGLSSSSKQPRVGRISRTDLVLGMQTYAPDKLIKYGKSRSQAIESSHQAELLALQTLLAAIPFDADDKFDYAAYVRANTGDVGTGKL